MTPDDVLHFCFPSDVDATHERHVEFWRWFMQGGTGEAIREKFADSVDRALVGEFDEWPQTSPGRLALVLVLDQFSRSLYPGSTRAFAQDQLALELCVTGLENGHFDELATPWERTLFALPLVHAEGPDHRERVRLGEELAVATLEMARADLKPMYGFCLGQSRRHRAVIEEFGRHPHRNEILGRDTTPAEQAYLDRDELPHETALPQILES